MTDFQEKKRIARYVYSKASLALLFIIIAILISATWGVYGKYSETKIDKHMALRMVSKLTVQRDNLEKKIRELGTAHGIEEEIRATFGFTKKREGIIIFLNTQQNDEPARSRRITDLFWNVFGALKKMLD